MKKQASRMRKRPELIRSSLPGLCSHCSSAFGNESSRKRTFYFPAPQRLIEQTYLSQQLADEFIWHSVWTSLRLIQRFLEEDGGDIR
jgi:hypothetical protein